MMLQLNPPIPVWVEDQGEGYALGWINISQEHHLIWIVAFNATSEVWEIPNPRIRLQVNWTMGRNINEL